MCKPTLGDHAGPDRWRSVWSKQDTPTPHRRALAIPTAARSTKRTPHGCAQVGFDRPRLGGRIVPAADAFCSPLLDSPAFLLLSWIFLRVCLILPVYRLSHCLCDTGIDPSSAQVLKKEKIHSVRPPRPHSSQVPLSPIARHVPLPTIPPFVWAHCERVPGRSSNLPPPTHSVSLPQRIPRSRC